MIKVWRFDEAPPEYKRLSPAIGGEAFVIESNEEYKVVAQQIAFRITRGSYHAVIYTDKTIFIVYT